MIRKMSGRGVMVVLAAVILASVCGCGARARARAMASRSRMKQLVVMAIHYRVSNRAWPDRLDQLKRHAAAESWDDLITNPVTGDKPGYEYVKPAADSANAVILYQLRGGKRDLSLAVGHADGSVSSPVSH